ncbi:MAG: RNA polymerase sigma factor [Coprobacillaceae bacterium]
MSKEDLVSEEIVLDAINGNPEAFTQIYQAYYKRVYFMAIQFFKNEEVAKDIVQEVFIKVYKQLKKLKVPKAFSSWLHVITYRECQNHNRRKMKIFELGKEEYIEDFPDVNEIDITDKVENERIKDEIMNILNTMSEPLRTVAILRFFEELKLQEIADVLDIPKNTVSSRLIKIRKILSTNLEKKGIHKQYGTIIFSPTLIHEIYNMMFDKCTMNDVTANNILNTILSGSAATTGGISILTKLFLGSLIPAFTVSGIVLWSQSITKEAKVETKPSILQTLEIEDLAIITDVIYNDNWTNEEVQIEVQTSNNNYDKICINNEEILQIHTNGSYNIQLFKNNQIIDEREIIISNIDQEHPSARGVEENNDYVLYLSDNTSGIDSQSIEYYKNGIISNAYIYNSNERKIVFENDKTSIHEFYVRDYAGNILSITVKLI